MKSATHSSNCEICTAAIDQSQNSSICETCEKEQKIGMIRIANVDHPHHYGGKNNPYEAIKVIEAWKLDFCIGNAVKYISRAGKKQNEIEDLEKAIWYIKRKVERLKSAIE
jgi:hypothetical protein